ncbi:MAG TPA: hypothetical protein VMB48_13970 [Steroidobacteraceae bacterium]|nr:hypothetical protein [Steroidobacteraceae bacterium]
MIALFAQHSAVAQSLHDPLLGRLVGTWVLRGEIAHRPVTHTVKVQWVLAHQYIQIRETSRSRTAAGAPEYEAIVYIGWDPDLKQYACLWLDSTGGNGLVGWALGHAAPDATKLAFLFSNKNGDPSVHNTFDYDRITDTWRWTIDNMDEGKLQPFADVKLTRQRE